MGAGRCFLIAGLLWTTSASAEKTLRPVNLSMTVPEGWELMNERDGDFLHYESSEDSEPRTIDLSFAREAGTTCKAWQAPPHAKKAKPAYWPKDARTSLFVTQTQGKVTATGCLANTPTGALVVNIETLSDNPTYTPSAIDTGMLRGALAAALAGAAPATAPTTAASTKSPPTSSTKSTPTATAAVKAGTKVTIPQLDLSLKVPVDGNWIAGARGESKLETDLRTGDASAKLNISLFALSARTCLEWRVDTSTSDRVTFVAHPDYLPKAAAVGAFELSVDNSLQTSTCLDTPLGPLGLSVQFRRTFDESARPLVRKTIEAIAAGSTSYTRPSFDGLVTVDGGNSAKVSVGTITLPKGAAWRIADGVVERSDKGHYFSLASMSQSTPCNAPAAKPQPFLPDGLTATVETKATGATVARVCVQTTRTVELTLAYDGAIDKADHALLKALVAAFVPKKPTPKS